MTKLQAIRELSHYDHVFLSKKTVEKLCRPFGLKPITYTATDTRSQFKGLTLNGKKEGDKAEGQDAHRLACYIADQLHVEYPDMNGIGSLLRSACGAVEDYLLEQEKGEAMLRVHLGK